MTFCASKLIVQTVAETAVYVIAACLICMKPLVYLLWSKCGLRSSSCAVDSFSDSLMSMELDTLGGISRKTRISISSSRIDPELSLESDGKI
jgi:hypothetical protein